MKIARNGEWLGATVGTEYALMSVENGNYIVLSHVGTRIWELLKDPKTLEQICAQLVEEFDVTPDVCRAEVEAFINDLKNASAAVDIAD